jgi:hypothetical protein
MRLMNETWPKNLSIQKPLEKVSFISDHELFIMLISFSFLFGLIKL